MIHFGADISKQDLNGREPLDEAIQNGHHKVAALLYEAGASLSADQKLKYEMKMWHYVKTSNLNALKGLVDSGISPLCVDYLGRSLLHLAVEERDINIVQYLLARDLDVNLRDLRGENALDIALKNQDSVLESVLVSAGAKHKTESDPLREPPHSVRTNPVASFAIMQSCPESIASAILRGLDVAPRSRKDVSLLFSDVVGFTAISSALPPIKVSRMLDSLFKRLDRLAHLHGVQKVDVVGDAYIAAANFTEDQPGDHAARLARFAVDAAAAAAAVAIDPDAPGDRAGRCIQIRVGLHCGEVTGIVAERGGLKYTLIGEAVQVAARMESQGAAGMVQCSAASARLIEEQADDLAVTRRRAPRVGTNARIRARARKHTRPHAHTTTHNHCAALCLHV